MPGKISKKQAKIELEEKAKKVTNEDLEHLISNAEEIEHKISSSGPLQRFIKDAKIMLCMVKDYYNGSYRHVPWWSLAAVVAALLYVFSPIDALPDFIPAIGLLDDAAVMSACLLMVEQDLRLYEQSRISAAVKAA